MIGLIKSYIRYRYVMRMLTHYGVVVQHFERDRFKYVARVNPKDIWERSRMVSPNPAEGFTQPLAIRNLIWTIAQDHRNEFYIKRFADARPDVKK